MKAMLPNLFVRLKNTKQLEYDKISKRITIKFVCQPK